MPASVSLRSPRVYRPVLVLSLLIIGASFVVDFSMGATAFALLMIAVVATGIPHGAVDHLVASELYGLRFTWRDQAKFYGAYLALMALYGGLWLVASGLSLFLFLLMTIYHFGQADLAYLRPTGWRRPAAYLSRGLLVIGLPIVAFPGIVDPIFDAIATTHLLEWTWMTEHASMLALGLVAQHGAMLAGLRPLMDRAALQREMLSTGIFALLFWTVHPLVAFAVYFGGWHALGHILELIRFFNRHDQPTSITDFYRKAAVFTVLSFVMLGALYVAAQAFGSQEQMIALLFILISVMTLPHMIIVERMYQHKRQKAHPAEAR